MSTDMNAIMGKLVADELKKMQAADANFDPRGAQGAEVDSVTAEILKNMGTGGTSGQAPGSNLPEEVKKDFDWIIQALLANPLVIPYVAQHLDGVLTRFNTALHEMMRAAFDYNPEAFTPTPPRPTPEEPAAAAPAAAAPVAAPAPTPTAAPVATPPVSGRGTGR